ncbi:MAG: PQQ-binding-like beta-propeller repeat protein [Planctomycetia bacterium]
MRPDQRSRSIAPSAARPLWPPRRVLVSLASLATATVLVRAGLLEPVVGSIVDQAVRNIITLILVFAALVSLLLWFVRESGHAAWLKQMVFGGLLGAVVVAAGMLRIERVSGDLVPEFAWRWAPSRDRLLTARPAAAPAADAPAWEPTSTDFPRFLGPAGDLGLESPTLDADWATRPPRELWRRPIGAGWSGFVTCGDHAVTLEQRGDDEVVACYAVATGEPEWAVSVPARHETVLGGVGPRSTPTIRDGVVYTTGATGLLHAIDGATGRVLWKKDVVADLGIDAAAHAAAVAWGRAGSPLVIDDVVVVPGGGPRSAKPEFVSLVAYDRATGEQRWTAGDEQISYVTPHLATLGGREVILAVNEARVVGYDPATRDVVWQFDFAGHSNSDASCSQAVVLDDRRVFISKGYGIGAAVFELGDTGAATPWTLREVWHETGNLKTKFTNVAIHEDHAYGLSDGILECVRLADGKRMWKGGRYGQGQVLRVGVLLLVQAESGEVVLVDAAPAKHVVRGRLEALRGQTWNNLCLSGRRLLVRNAEEAACYELPVKAADVAVFMAPAQSSLR